MTQRNVPFAINEFYHIYNRGTDKRTIFLDARDYKRFIELLYLCNSTLAVNVRNVYRDHDSVYDFERGPQLVSVGAYCLMPNHFHMLLTPQVEEGVSKFMNKLGTSYSMYFNKRYDRTGALFQGRFKSEHAADDRYVRYLYSYIHLNPVKLIQSDWKERGIQDLQTAVLHAKQYPYSSARHYLGQSKKPDEIINTSSFPEYFQTGLEHEQELSEWLTYDDAPQFA